MDSVGQMLCPAVGCGGHTSARSSLVVSGNNHILPALPSAQYSIHNRAYGYNVCTQKTPFNRPSFRTILLARASVCYTHNLLILKGIVSYFICVGVQGN